MGPVVETRSGALEGRRIGATDEFLGIPYAAPPVGPLRFRPPEPVASWPGVRPALTPGPACPQPPSALPGMEPGPQHEACLFLNVTTPRADGGRRPVLVWFHGGGFTTGSASQALYRGTRLAERGDVVVVTANYRLGALGFLHARSADLPLEGACDNAGLLDQIAALRWVHENIAAFGGDPERVTIFGESAGGMSVATLLAMPGARGLFARAIAQSGAAQATYDRDAAARVAHRLLAELGLEARSAERLRSVPAERLLEAQTRVVAALQRDAFLVFAPVVEPETLPTHPLEAVARGAARDVPLLTGTTADEWRLFTFAVPGHRRLDTDGLRRRVAHRLERIGRGDPAEILRVYSALRPGAAPWELFDAIETDRLFRMPALRLAEAQLAHQPETFMYQFRWPSPAGHGRLGACHAVELPFVFGTLDVPFVGRFSGSGPAAEALSRRVMDAWTAFARSGSPDGVCGQPWPRYEARARLTRIFAAADSVEADPEAETRRLWGQILPPS